MKPPKSSGHLFVLLICLLFGFRPEGSAQVSAVDVWGDNSRGQINVPVSVTNAIALAAGDYHCLALRADGTVRAWGDNSWGQTNVPSNITNVIAVAAGSTHSLAALDDGTVRLWGRISGSFINTVPAGASNVVAVALGPAAQHALILRADGSVVDWGNANYGLTNPPVTASRVVGVAAGGAHSLAVRSDGRAVAWGNNGSFQINVPSSATNIVAVAAGSSHSAALRANGTVVTWGIGVGSPPASATNVIDIASGANHVLALRRDGTLVAWGNNSYGQATVPIFATNLSAIAGGSYDSLGLVFWGPPQLQKGLTNVIVNAGTTNYLRVRAVGALPLAYQWSSNGISINGATNPVLTLANVAMNQSGSFYALGVSNQYDVAQSAPIYLTVTPLEIAIQPATQNVFFGSNAVLTTVTSGQGPFAYQWKMFGTNIPGATQNSLTLTNIQVDQSGPYSVEATNSLGAVVSADAVITVVPLFVTAQPQSMTVVRWTGAALSVTADGAPPIRYQWRLNGSNVLGATNSIFTVPSMQAANSGTYSVAISNNYAGLISASAELRMTSVAAWGASDCGLLAVPASASNVMGIAAGYVNGIVLRNDGTVVVWGCNDSGQNIVPATATNVVSAVGGYRSFSVLKAGGTTVGWGLNSSGESDAPPSFTNGVQIAGIISHRLGLKADGTAVGWGYNGYGVADIPAGLENLMGIAAGYNHSAVLRADGTVVVWGLGDLTRTNLPPNLTNVVAIAAGNNHTLALRTDGTVVAWGDNTSGQTNVPPSLTNVVAISGGWQHSLALKADGTVSAWGDNSLDQLNIPAGLTNVVAIAAGGYFNLALVGDGPPTSNGFPADPDWRGNVFHISVASQINTVYRLEYKNELSDTNWVGLPLVAGTGRLLILADTTANGSHRFYRVRRW
jgi:alpha-tubulin suppressor-like RCC1 family protein